jgi:predicted nucleic acid-binding protein
LIVVFDASVLVYLLDEQAKPPIDDKTGKPVSHCRERIESLLADLQNKSAKIIIPTPALAEVLVKANKAGRDYLDILENSKSFRVASFDKRAAVEFAAMQAARVTVGKKASTSRLKAKFDDQIVAIASIESATTIYSDDEDIAKLSGSRFEVIKVSQIPLPPEVAQPSLPFDREQAKARKVNLDDE